MSSPKIICKSGYIKNSTHVLNTLNYAGNKLAAQYILYTDGTRKKVNGETRIVLTQAQQRDVSAIHLEYKDGGSKRITYSAYQKHTNETQESITVSELEVVADEEILQTSADEKEYHRTQDLDFFKYLHYIEDREGVEKVDGHGLFSLHGNVSIEDANAMALEYESSRKWSHIISLEAEGAKQAGFDRRHMWVDLIRSKAPQFAKAYNISLENLVVNCAFHGNTDNPHVHLLFYSKDPREGFIKGGIKGMQAASDKLKSMLFNSIYKHDVAHIKQEKTVLRDAVRDQMQEYLKNIRTKDCANPQLENKLLQLAKSLHNLSGKKQYGYLPQPIKAQVNDILRWIVATDNDIQGLYTSYMQVHKQFVSQYVADPEKIEASMQEYAERFFVPQKSDLKLYHNAIIKAALSLDVVPTAPAAGARATKEETEHSAKAESVVSTPDTEPEEYIPPPSDEDVPPSIEQDQYIDVSQSTSSEYMYPPTDEDVPLDNWNSVLDEDIPPPSDEDVPSDNWNSVSSEDMPLPSDEDVPPKSVAGTRATKKKTGHSTKVNASTSKYVRYKDMDEFLSKQKNCLNKKSFSKIYWKTFRGIFNPKIENTSLQKYAVEEMEKLRNLEAEQRYSSTAKKHTKNIFSVLYTTDGNFTKEIQDMFSVSRIALEKEYGKENAERYLQNFEQNMHSLKYTNAAHSYIAYFAKTLEDQQYYQLLDAYQELNKPLNKALYKAVRELYDNKETRMDLLQTLKQIQTLSPYLDDKEVNKEVCDLVRPLFNTLVNLEAVQPVFAQYEDEYGKVLDANMKRPEVYRKRLHKNLQEVNRLMRPHYSIIQFSKNYEQLVYDKIVRNKEIYKSLNKGLFRCLRQSLTDSDSFSSSLIRQELEQYSTTKNKKHIQQIFQYLYNTDKVMRTQVDGTTEAVYAKLKEELGTETAIEWIQKYKQELFAEDSSLSMHWSIGRFAENLSEQYYMQILSKHKEILKPIYKAVFQKLNDRLDDPDILRQLNALRDSMNDENPNKEECAKAASILFQSLHDEDMANLFAHLDEEWKPLIEQYCDDPNMALELFHRFQTDIYNGNNSAIQFIIQSYAKDLECNRAKLVYGKIVRNKEVHKPLNKCLFNCLRQSLTDSDSFSSSLIRQELELYSTTKNKKHIQQIFQYLYNTDKNMHTQVDATTEAVYAKLKEELGTETATEWIQKYKEELFAEDSSLSMHWSIGRFAENISEQYYMQILSKHKEIMKPLYKIVFQQLNNSLENPDILKQLNALRDSLQEENPNKEECAKAASVLFQSLHDEDMVNLFTQIEKEWKPLVEQYCDDPNMALELLHRFQADLYHGNNSGIEFIIKNYADNLELHQTKFVLKEMKDQLKEFRSALYREVRKTILSGNPYVDSLLRAVQENPKSADKLNDLLLALSSESVDFIQWKDWLSTSFSEQMKQKGFTYSAEEYRELFDMFFYSTGENKYDTLFMQNTIIGAYQNKDKFLADASQYQARAVCSSLIYNLARLLYSQSETALTNTSNPQEKQKKRFKNRKRKGKRRNIAREINF